MAATTSCAIVQNESYTSEKTNLSKTLLNEKIEYYKRLYPELAFLILQGDDLLGDMIVFDHVLGNQATSLDYEHPSDLREDLMYVSVERILLMLRSHAPSASTFKADTPPDWQEHVCVLTIDPNEMAADSVQATQHLLSLPKKVVQKIPQDLQLSPDDYLAFVIDHEIYHCLKSMYVGPQLMSHKELWGEYNHFINEQGADAYALGMHIKTRGDVSSFAKNILRIRGMTLYNADPDHLTCKAMKQVLKIPTENITEMSANEIFNIANSIRDNMNTGYNEYIKYLASAIQAMDEIGVGELVSVELRNMIKDVQVDPKQVEKLVANTRRCLTELSGENPEP